MFVLSGCAWCGEQLALVGCDELSLTHPTINRTVIWSDYAARATQPGTDDHRSAIRSDHPDPVHARPSVVGYTEATEARNATRTFAGWDNRYGSRALWDASVAQLRYCAEL